MQAFVLLGVSGSGMSTVGIHITARLSWPYLEEDDFHTPTNLKKMYEGISLTDAECAPAIGALSRAINNQMQPCVIVACSELTKYLRQYLDNCVQRPIRFIHLRTPAKDNFAIQLQRPRVLEAVRQEDLAVAVEASERSIEIDADGGIDVVTSRVVSRVRTLARIYWP